MAVDSKAKKQAYFNKLVQCVNDYNKILLVEADNVGSAQMQQIRIALRGKAVLLMGKNTMIRRALRGHLDKHQGLSEFMTHVKGNVGFVFTKGNLAEIKNKVVSMRVDAPAKVGTFAPTSVTVPAGPTGLDPTQTSFLQALNIASKINKAQVEIINDHLLLKQGDKVGQSEAALLQKLNIRPFSYGLKVRIVYDAGAIYAPEIIDLTEQDILNKFLDGVRNVAAVGLQLSFPSAASVPHLVTNAYRNLLAIAVQSEVKFPRADKIREYLKNPGAHAADAHSGEHKKDESKGDDDNKKGKGKQEKEKAKEEKKPEPEPEDGGDMGLSLFD